MQFRTLHMAILRRHHHALRRRATTVTVTDHKERHLGWPQQEPPFLLSLSQHPHRHLKNSQLCLQHNQDQTCSKRLRLFTSTFDQNVSHRNQRVSGRQLSASRAVSADELVALSAGARRVSRSLQITHMGVRVEVGRNMKRIPVVGAPVRRSVRHPRNPTQRVVHTRNTWVLTWDRWLDHQSGMARVGWCLDDR